MSLMSLRRLSALGSSVTLAYALQAAGPAWASSAAVGLQEALDQALQTHPSILEKRNNLEAARHALSGARWMRFPNVVAEASANPTTGPVQVLRVDQPLWTGGRITANIATTQAKLTAAESAFVDAQRQILLRTTSLFAELVRVGSRLDAARENIAEHERLLGLIQRRSDSGIASPSEVVSAKARLQQARTELVQLQTAALNARSELEQITGMTIAEIKVPKPDLEAAPNVVELIDRAMAYSPELRRLAAETVAASAEIDSRKAAILPKLSVRHEQLWGNDRRTSASYVALTMQTGNGLSAVSAISEAASQRSAAMDRESTTRRDIAVSVRNDWNKVLSAKAETAVLRELTESTRDMYESFVRQYAAGRKSWLDVLNARSESIKARNTLVDTEWNGMLASWRLQIATGDLSAGNLTRLSGGPGQGSDSGQRMQIGMAISAEPARRP